MKHIILTIFIAAAAIAETGAAADVETAGEHRIEIPSLATGYPRIIGNESEREDIARMLATPEGAAAMQELKDRMEVYVSRHETDPQWIVSRLQMYWQSHATDVYVNGETLDHVDGCAPVPTVRYSACRSGISNYARPKLEDVLPYQDSLGLWMINRATGEAEWADHRKTGGNIESINREIMGLARDAAFLYWLDGDERCARFAEDIFDTYMTGLYYRNVPVDLNHGQQQTLVGLTSFEVIHEDISATAAECYDYLHDYLDAAKRPLYEDAFRKWADNIIAGGVPHNNWDLIQARFVLQIALVLGGDSSYADGKGREYYLNQILNESSIRQWSMGKLIDFGFDSRTGLWKESPGYATMVLGEFTSFVRTMDRTLGVDLAAEYPILAKGVANAPQYLFPNGLGVNWGDGHYGKMRTDIYSRMAANARQYGKRDQEELFTAMLLCFDPAARAAVAQTEAAANATPAPAAGTAGRTAAPKKLAAKVETFTTEKAFVPDPAIEAGDTLDYVTPTFYCEEASWFAARSGMDPKKSLMMSVCGSKGNHMHANGISMELYGKGWVQAPDLGRGKGYTTLDYAEFYSQFPAHNTVCVDGVSSYPTMMSQHAYSLNGCYPAPERREDHYEGVLYGDFYFNEPETDADQRRQLIIINTDPDNGYYVDIFRSRRRDGRDKMHDYFYHNIGQEFTLDVPVKPTEELAFAGGHLYAYSYLWDKYSATTSEDVSGKFTMTMKDGSQSGMRLWLRGEQGRTVFKALSPAIDALTRTPMPYDVKNSPCQTFVARQEGEAWNRPFAAVYEPYESAANAGEGAIETVTWPESLAEGLVVLKVKKRDGRTDIIFSNDRMQAFSGEGVSGTAVIAVVSDGQYFMAGGTDLSAGNVRIATDSPSTAALWQKDGQWHYSSDAPCKISIGKKKYTLPAAASATIGQ